jgi:hypothetical protein
MHLYFTISQFEDAKELRKPIDFLMASSYVKAKK